MASVGAQREIDAGVGVQFLPRRIAAEEAGERRAILGARPPAAAGVDVVVPLIQQQVDADAGRLLAVNRQAVLLAVGDIGDDGQAAFDGSDG